jgi:predicted  nucleic acid-binding Zn-ribbon protein
MKATPDQQQQILRLAQLDQELSVGSAQLRHLREGAEIAAIRTELIQSSERLLEGRTELENITAELKRSESDLELVEKRIAQDNERLLTVSSHKDADGISHELVSLKTRLSNLEDVELEIMERRDAATAALETLTAERADIAQKLSVAEATAEAEIIKLQSGLSLVAGERKSVQDSLPAELFELYEKKASRGVAAGRLINRDCDACRIALTSAAYEDVIATAQDEIATCPNCQAILVR